MFIKIIDVYENCHILNKNNILCIREHLPTYNEVESKSVIEFGVGFLEAIYMKETVDELNEEYKFT